MPNVDNETGIHFGIILSGNVGQGWYDQSVGQYPCDCCDDAQNEEGCDGMCEPDSFTYREDGYDCVQFGDSPDIIVCKSPFYTFAHQCSPCYPNAGDLDTPDENGLKTYCFGHDWFDGDVAPYPVFDVKTDKVVSP